jgi:SapC protein
MPTQLLIYQSAVPISRARHANWSVELGSSYAFSADLNSVPLMAVEFPLAASEYAIVFAGRENELIPAVILGLRGNENLFLTKDGHWGARYVPAFIRRYPFVFSREADRVVLCIDEAFPGCNQEGRGERLFNDDGTPTQYVNNVLKFLQEYQDQFRRTQQFCAKLKELDLIDPMQAQMATTGQPVSLGGFLAVNRQKLKALSGEALAALAKTDELELVYLHLQSMRNFDFLRARMNLARNDAPAPTPTPVASPDPSAAPPEATGPARGNGTAEGH